MKAVAVKPSNGHFRYKFSPRLAEAILCGKVTRVNVPLRFAGPVRTAATGGFQVVERHLYARSDDRRLVSFFPSCRFGLAAEESSFWNGKHVPTAKPVRFIDADGGCSGEPRETPPLNQMEQRCPSDMRKWSTRLWGEVLSAERMSLLDLTTEQKYQSGARLSGVRCHPGQSELFDRAFRGLWDAAWASIGHEHDSDPEIISLRLSVNDRSFRQCVSREVGGPGHTSTLEAVDTA